MVYYVVLATAVLAETLMAPNPVLSQVLEMNMCDKNWIWIDIYNISANIK